MIDSKDGLEVVAKLAWKGKHKRGKAKTIHASQTVLVAPVFSPPKPTPSPFSHNALKPPSNYRTLQSKQGHEKIVCDASPYGLVRLVLLEKNSILTMMENGVDHNLFMLKHSNL